MDIGTEQGRHEPSRALVAAIAIVGRALIVTLLIHYGTVQAGTAPVMAAIVMIVVTAAMLVWAFDIAPRPGDHELRARRRGLLGHFGAARRIDRRGRDREGSPRPMRPGPERPVDAPWGGFRLRERVLRSGPGPGRAPRRCLMRFAQIRPIFDVTIW